MTKLLMNCWYMGAWAEEVLDVPLSRVLLDMGVMFYRTSGGSGAELPGGRA